MPDVSVRAFPDVPQQIATTAIEAYRCRDVADAHRAVVLLARSVIEAAAKDRGVTSGDLFKKIERLYEKRLNSQDVRDGAHEIRYLGNDMAHGDFGQVVRLALMNDVLASAYRRRCGWSRPGQSGSVPAHRYDNGRGKVAAGWTAA